MKEVAQIAYNAAAHQNELERNPLRQRGQIEQRNIRDRKAIEYEANQRDHALQSRMIREQSAADEQMHSRALSRMSRQKENITYAAQEQRRLIEVAKVANVQAPNMLEYGPD